MSLTDKQLDAWERDNRAPMASGHLQRWVFIVSQDYAKTNADIERVIIGTLHRLSPGAATNVKLLRTSPSRINLSGPVMTREQLPSSPLPVVQPGPVNWAEVQFAWRSPQATVPWPAERLALGLLAMTDPEDAQVLLDSVSVPGVVAPTPRNPIEKAIDDLGDSLVETPQRAGLALAGAALGAYLIYRATRK